MKDLKLRQVSKELARLSEVCLFTRPSGGWIKTIRESLSMTSIQFAKRLGVIQQRISRLEKAERDSIIKLKTLEEAAKALNCRLVYFFIPNEPLEQMLENRARLIAKNRIAEISHSMELEDQGISQEEQNIQIEKLALELLKNNLKILWDEEWK
jgi:predicted DNA-binding mobile mystery protein A